MAGLDEYDPQAIQMKWSARWEAGGCFHSEPSPDKQPYSIVIPPPNVTGALHLGHALNGTLQDVMIRMKRMQGYETLWMPGADHAGIATQAVVEKRLLEQEHKTRHEIGREALVARIWAWKDEYEARIVRQLKAMGASCDWQRWRFTLDDRCAKAVRHTFFRLFRDGFIYRGKRLVNWDVQLQTAVADDEVYHEKLQGRLWHVRYPIEGTGDYVEVATTRPETMLGDTAVAVHPNDKRYRHLIGRPVRLPLMDRLIPLIADELLVDPTFGTGAVKVTPAHDPNDYACGLRNGLAMRNILEPDGRINANGGVYAGLSREKARERVVADLEALGLVSKVEPHLHDVGHSDRSKTPIEPYLSDQWFVKMDHLAERAMAMVREGKVRFHPARYADTYLSWLGEKRDWCISRQLWWGHQIPVWYSTASQGRLEAAFAGRNDVVWHRDTEHDRWLLCALDDPADDAIAGESLTRDPDVLDTWFSSALWPHSTMGWPDETAELNFYYPTSMLVTAREIITLWVARMVLMSDFNLGEIPFRDVYVHPIIQDGEGRPMKKTLGNGVDPFDIIEKYGADAMRYTLVSMATETQDVRMPVKRETLPDGRTINTSEKFELGRNFGTKIFNAAKLILGNLDGYAPGPIDRAELFTEDRWILHRLSRTTALVTEQLDRYEFAGVCRLLYDFIWSELCDWYLEIVKPRLREPATGPLAQRMNALLLDATARLLHPVMPFLSEEIWEALGAVAPVRGGYPAPAPAAGLAAIAPWPKPVPDWEDETIAEQMGLLQEIVRGVRNLRSQFNVAPRELLDVIVACDAKSAVVLRANESTIRPLARIATLEVGPGKQRPAQSAASVLAGATVYVPLAGHIDLTAEIKRQTQKLAELKGRFAGIAKKLENKNFVAKAPADVVEQQRALKDDLAGQMAAVEVIIKELA